MTSSEDLRKELDKLKTDVANLRTRGGEQMHAMRDSAEDELRERRQLLRRGIRAGQERGRHAMEEVEEELSARPYASFLAAIGLGFILAKLLDIATHR